MKMNYDTQEGRSGAMVVALDWAVTHLSISASQKRERMQASDVMTSLLHAEQEIQIALAGCFVPLIEWHKVKREEIAHTFGPEVADLADMASRKEGVSESEWEEDLVECVVPGARIAVVAIRLAIVRFKLLSITAESRRPNDPMRDDRSALLTHATKWHVIGQHHFGADHELVANLSRGITAANRRFQHACRAEQPK